MNRQPSSRARLRKAGASESFSGTDIQRIGESPIPKLAPTHAITTQSARDQPLRQSPSFGTTLLWENRLLYELSLGEESPALRVTGVGSTSRYYFLGGKSPALRVIMGGGTLVVTKLMWF